MALLAAVALTAAPGHGAEEPAAAAAELPKPEPLRLATSDGIELATWLYAVAGEEPAVATVIVLHDLGGSHASVEPLALGLQAAGCAVLVPDLRGHGKSPIARLARAASGSDQSKLLKRNDFADMAATSGGRLRDQSTIRGDVECIRNWIKDKAAGGASLDRLFVVGSGLGGSVAAAWTIADAAWPPIASGPQGGHVRGLVLVDPSFTTKGFSIGPALALEPVRTSLPVMILGGPGGGDAAKLFDQLKRQRPDDWFDSRARDPETGKGNSPAKDSEASALYFTVDARPVAGRPAAIDAIASWRSPDGRGFDAAKFIVAFIKLVIARVE